MSGRETERRKDRDTDRPGWLTSLPGAAQDGEARPVAPAGLGNTPGTEPDGDRGKGQPSQSFGEIARAHWGNTPPDWIARLVEECAFTSQARTARRLGLSPTVVNHVLRNKYQGSMANVEDAVRGALMHERIACPALGSIEREACRAWRRKARTYLPSNPLRITMFRACTKCPHNRKGTSDARTTD